MGHGVLSSGSTCLPIVRAVSDLCPASEMRRAVHFAAATVGAFTSELSDTVNFGGPLYRASKGLQRDHRRDQQGTL